MALYSQMYCNGASKSKEDVIVQEYGPLVKRQLPRFHTHFQKSRAGLSLTRLTSLCAKSFCFGSLARRCAPLAVCIQRARRRVHLWASRVPSMMGGILLPCRRS